MVRYAAQILYEKRSSSSIASKEEKNPASKRKTVSGTIHANNKKNYINDWEEKNSAFVRKNDEYVINEADL
uniref:RRP15-like protein n=1 Tax=Romanomermis culicivorax TaxID=13658 RepID=A0A915IQ10_ROMCU